MLSTAPEDLRLVIVLPSLARVRYTLAVAAVIIGVVLALWGLAQGTESGCELSPDGVNVVCSGYTWVYRQLLPLVGGTLLAFIGYRQRR